MAKAGEVEALLAQGVNPTEVARQLGIGRSSVYRAMKVRKIKRQPTCLSARIVAHPDAPQCFLLMGLPTGRCRRAVPRPRLPRTRPS